MLFLCRKRYKRHKMAKRKVRFVIVYYLRLWAQKNSYFFLTTELDRKPHAFQKNLVCVEPRNQSASAPLQLACQKMTNCTINVSGFLMTFYNTDTVTASVLTCEKNIFLLFLLRFVWYALRHKRVKKITSISRCRAGNDRTQVLSRQKRYSKFYAGKQPMKNRCFFSGPIIKSTREVFCQHNNHGGSHVHNIETEK